MKAYLVRVLILSSILINGCASHNGNWGANTTLTPGWRKINEAAFAALKDPHTWAPLIAAAAFSMDDFDQQTVDWATRRNPIFGNAKDAGDAANVLEDISQANYLITVIAASSGHGKESFYNKSKGLMVGITSYAITKSANSTIKDTVGRNRPNKTTGGGSFPSGAASRTSVAARLASRNIEHINLTQQQKIFWQMSSYTTAGLSGWARIETGRHYPSDILAGYALGSFIGAFMNDAFIDPDYQDRLQIEATVNNMDEKCLSITYWW